MNHRPCTWLSLLFSLTVTAFATPSESREVLDLFTAGEGGYASYRIPAIVVTPAQTILAACEARISRRGDWDQVDLLMRRSTDGGRHWSPARVLVGQPDLPGDQQRNSAAVAAGLGSEGVFTINNPTWITAPASGETHLLYCTEYYRAFIITTRDEGVTFSAPREITATFAAFRSRDDYPWSVIAIGPGHGTRLSSGRLVAAVWLSTGQGGHAHRPSVCATIYSDDQGATWQAGEIVARDPDPLPNPSESVIAEVSPGRVMMNIRSESSRNQRAIAWSSDGASNWSIPTFDPSLPEPVCMAGLIRLDPMSASSPTTLLFSNPASLKSKPGDTKTTSRVRENLTLRASQDGGKTWTTLRVLEPGLSAYSDLALSADGTLFCLYERGDDSPYENLTLARIDVGPLLHSTP